MSPSRAKRRAARNAAQPTYDARSARMNEHVHPSAMSSQVRNRKAVRMTATQRSAHGPRSLWNNSPYYKNATTIDARWSA